MTAFEVPHRRHNPLTNEWVLVSQGRSNRPWQGAREKVTPTVRERFSNDCFLCPGNKRVSGVVNPAYESTYVFDNDFASLRPDVAESSTHELLRVAEAAAGKCRVICYSPRHDVDLGSMSVAELRAVVDVWADQHAELSAEFNWVQIFENRGRGMGASSEHPHCQVWASSSLPTIPTKENDSQLEYHTTRGSNLLLDYVELEEGSERVVCQNDSWMAMVPFWAAWPFELLIVPKAHRTSFELLDDADRDDLAHLLLTVVNIYDGLFQVPFPYSLGWHTAPASLDDASHWQMHGHVFPPLLRSATVRKFMVGYELLAEPQRDFSPEEAAARLRSVADTVSV